ncbi:hypothetical protein AX15_003063 [Amanita polypyramis BW_CC]|nr:hypothetical protein AX15_003063 [Amanita polypyramis BW_CC]
MQTKKTITIVTSPSDATSSLPPSEGYLSPTTSRKGGTTQYRIEERTRTIYVTSDKDPSKWDQHSITEILKVTEIADTDPSHSRLSIRRSKSQPLDLQMPVSDPRSSVSSPDSKEIPPRTASKSHKRDTKAGISLQIPSTHTPSPFSPIRLSSQRSTERQRVLFYHKHDPYYGFTNFSPHPVVYKGNKYPTSEHLFQSFKFHDHRPGLAEHIRTCSERPSVAFSEARRFQPEVRPDWLQINIQKMEDVLWHKFNQHPDLKAELLSTGSAELIEVSGCHWV